MFVVDLGGEKDRVGSCLIVAVDVASTLAILAKDLFGAVVDDVGEDQAIREKAEHFVNVSKLIGLDNAEVKAIGLQGAVGGVQLISGIVVPKASGIGLLVFGQRRFAGGLTGDQAEKEKNTEEEGDGAAHGKRFSMAKVSKFPSKKTSCANDVHTGDFGLEGRAFCLLASHQSPTIWMGKYPPARRCSA